MKKRIYISGPMTGHPKLNRDAFRAAAVKLREQGHFVINPRDHERRCGMSVVTNVVLALAITTTQEVQCPCPDGIQGCCVMHTKEVSHTRYEPIKVDEHPDGNPCQSRGIALATNAVAEAVIAAYYGKGVPQFIPVRPLKCYGIAYGGHPMGFLIGDAVKKACGLPDDWKKWRIVNEW